MPEVNPGQKISHSNPQYRGTIFKNNENAHTFLRGQGKEGGPGASAEGKGVPPQPQFRLSPQGQRGLRTWPALPPGPKPQGPLLALLLFLSF